MGKETVDLMVEGGKAKPSPIFGQKFGPLGVNIQEILGEINKKTDDFQGTKVPVKVIVDTETKKFNIEVGTPPVSELIKKEINLQKGSGLAHVDKVANLAMEQVIKIAKMKKDSLLDKNLKAVVKTVIGSCGSLGILVESKEPKEIGKDINSGKYDSLIKEGKTEVSDEKLKELKEELEVVKERLKKERGLPIKKEEKKEEEDGEEKKEEGKEEEKKVEKKK